MRDAMRRCLRTAAILLLVASPGHAALIFVGDSASLGATLATDWGRFGGQAIANPFGYGYAVGQFLRVSKAQPGSFLRVDQGGDWGGSFALGSKLLATTNVNATANPATFDFEGTALESFGIQLQPNDLGAYTATIEGLDSSGTVLGSFTRSGVSTTAADGSALFLGIASDGTSDFSRVRIAITASGGGNIGGYAFGPAEFRLVALPAVVPEPGTLASAVVGGLIGLGVVWMARMADRRSRALFGGGEPNGDGASG